MLRVNDRNGSTIIVEGETYTVDDQRQLHIMDEKTKTPRITFHSHYWVSVSSIFDPSSPDETDTLDNGQLELPLGIL